MNELRTNWLLKHLANETQKEYVISVGDDQKIGYKEAMSEVKSSVVVASKMIELFKIDDARLHAVFQEVDKEYEAFNVKTLEIENRIMKYNQRLHDTQQFSQTYQRFFKRSKDREIGDQEFLPINVHLQQFSIGNQAQFSTVSCGATAAHTRGFRGNGLWNLLEVTMSNEEDGFGRAAVSHRFARHTTATDALITLRENWANILDSIDKLKQDQMTIENFIIAAKSLLQIIIDAIRAETDDNLSKTIRDSARLSADIIKTAQETIFQVT